MPRAGRHQQSSAAQKEVILNDIVPSPHTQAAVFWLARADPIAEVNLDTILSSRVNRTTQRHIGYLGYSSVSPIDVSCLHVGTQIFKKCMTVWRKKYLDKSYSAFPLLNAPSSAFIHNFMFKGSIHKTFTSKAGGLIDHDSNSLSMKIFEDKHPSFRLKQLAKIPIYHSVFSKALVCPDLVREGIVPK